jgi:O-antigen/teichoic acid export membrane protein
MVWSAQVPASSSKPPRQPGLPLRSKRSLLLTLGTNFGILGLTVATGTLNARLLGPSGRGELAAIQTIPSVLGMLSMLGLPSAVGYFAARSPIEARRLTVTALGICLLASLPAMAVGYRLMPWALHSQPDAVIGHARSYLIFIALQATVMMPYMALQGLGKFGVWNVLRMAPNLAALVAIILAWSGGKPTSGAYAGWYLVTFSLISPLVYGALWLNSNPHAEASPGRARALLRYGLPSAIMAPAGMLNLQLDQMMMAAWLPSQMLGLYAVSVSWSGLLSPAFGALGHVIFPTLAATHDLQAQRVLVGRSFRMAVVVVLILGGGLAAVTPILLPMFFGRSFALAVPAALVLVVAGMILSLNNLSGEVLRGLGVPRWPLFGQFAALPATVILLVLLLPRWTIVGAAVSSVIAYAVAGYVCLVGICRTCGANLGELLIPRRTDYLVLLGAARGVLARFRR